MNVFDRLESGDFANCPVVDAILLVEIDADDEHTAVLLESTTTRATVQLGILQFAVNHGVDAEGPEGDIGDDEDDPDDSAR